MWWYSESEGLRIRRTKGVSFILKIDRLETQEETMFHLESEVRKMPMSRVKAFRQEKSSPLLSLFVLLRATYIKEVTCFILSTDSNINLIQEHSQ